jgi:hypothetical protein
MLVIESPPCKYLPMTQNGRPEITDTGARVRGQATDGYAPPGRNFPTFGRGTTQHLCDPFEMQDLVLDEVEDDD